jgi:NADPH:quinone reductase-like Zn-dependent oxidoreductase
LIAFGFSNAATRGPKRNLIYALSQLARVSRFSPLDMMDKNRAVAGVNLGHLWSERELLREELLSLIELYQNGAIRPHIHAAVPFSHAAEAHQMLELGKNQGKVVLVPG